MQQQARCLPRIINSDIQYVRIYNSNESGNFRHRFETLKTRWINNHGFEKKFRSFETKLVYSYFCSLNTDYHVFFKRKHTDKEILNTFFGQLMLVFVGTTISIILTLGSAFLMEKHGQKQDRRLSAMMVMSNIEKFPEIWRKLQII